MFPDNTRSPGGTTDRRGFLSTLAGAGGALIALPGRGTAAPLVDATATVFYAQPDGESALVRFVVSGTDAPAGRLRVYDPRQRLLGTAGVISVGSTLYGELWLRVAGEMTIYSHLEIPGQRGVTRSEHRLREQPRWTLHFLTLADAEDLQRDLLDAPLLLEGARATALARAGVRGNVLALAESVETLDHVAFLSLCDDDKRVDSPYAFFGGTVVLDRSGTTDRVSTAGLMLAGSGVRHVIRRTPSESGFAWLGSPDGSRVLLAMVGPSGTPDSLGFGIDVNEMARRLERWLTTEPAFLSPSYPSRTALVLNEQPGRLTPALRHSIASWNERYAHPRIVVDDAEAMLEGIAAEPNGALPVRVANSGDPGSVDVRAETPRVRRTEQYAARTEAAIAILARQLAPAGRAGLETVAAQFAFPVPATLFFNSSPFPRTDVAVTPDGERRIVTDVPALGYVCLPREREPAAPAGATVSGVLDADGRYFRIALDETTGAVRSLAGQFDRVEYVRRGSRGLLAAEGARLSAVEKSWTPGIGIQLVAERQTPAGPESTTFTLYDDLPWLDVEVERSDGGAHAPLEYDFPFALDDPEVSWEVPAGTDTAVPPIHSLTHLRWIRMASPARTILLRGLDAPHAAVGADGALVSLAAGARLRYRIAVARTGTFDADPWRFGWGAEPIVSAPVPGDGPAALPSFGSLLVVDQPGVVILGVRAAATSNDAILYVQEVLGIARDATLGMGVLGFRAASQVDFRERYVGDLPLIGGRGVAVSLRPHGVTAVRLHDLTLAAK